MLGGMSVRNEQKGTDKLTTNLSESEHETY